MTHRLYRLVLGILLLVSLYFDFSYVIGALIIMVLLEGLTNLRIPLLIGRLRKRLGDPGQPAEEGMLNRGTGCPRFNFDAERGMSLFMGLILLLSYVMFYDRLWIIPWFMGFALLGSGVSGMCPMLIAFRRLGFK